MSERRHGTVFPGFKEMAQQRTSLAAALSAKRVELGLSQTEVAARMKTSQSAVARLESGQADLRLSRWSATPPRWASVWTGSCRCGRLRTRRAGYLPAGGLPALGALAPGAPRRSSRPGRGRPGCGRGHPRWRQLLDRRVVRLWGPARLDASVGRVCAEMMALDATGDAAVQLYVGSSGGPLPPGPDPHRHDGPARRACARDLPGPGAGGRHRLVAAGARRAAVPHAQFYLSEPEVSGERPRSASWRLGPTITELSSNVSSSAWPRPPADRPSTWKPTCRSGAGWTPSKRASTDWSTTSGGPAAPSA